ncbi:nucleolar protein 8 isoform X4 [Syngnathus acus]|uniref:nucleolar protein 8 isoform X4 n=1 Tax=Syngnathus acus TaxID=161584 RepID=UPI00188646F6|nr:nucleolar protein 8 isoform X4 [Syngnathus acus]
MPRLYVGGLSHSVTQKDLTDRFGNFGNVEDVELRTRRDEEGVPYKTFAYINLNISDTDLKKCMSVLNKSKWKGGTLQIELAKESFLQKLARERQAEQQRLRHNADDTHRREHKLLETLREAGVDNFTMKAAVPGTEVPGHKDWVVSKFGRVLPVMQLLCQKGAKARTIKYDPSKHCHNIRRLAPPTSIADPPTPVAQLTWRIDAGDDDISKRRRGEFPPYQPPKPKKARTDATKAGNDARSAQVVSTAEPENRHLLNRVSPADNRPPVQRSRHARSEDSDSDEELRRLVALEQTLQAPGEDPQDNLEVVGHDFKCGGRPTNNQDDDDYDSADTDELITFRKHPLCPRKNTRQESSLADLHKVAEKCQQSSDRRAQKRPTGKAIMPEDVLASHLRGGKDPPEFKKVAKTEFKKVAKTKYPPFRGTATLYEEVLEKTDSAQNKTNQPDASLLSNSENEAAAAKSKIKQDKRTKATAVLPEEDKDNVTRLELSLVDLPKVAEECQQSSDRRAPKKPTKKAIMPEDVLASLLRDGEDPPEFKKVAKTKYPAFRGTATLYEEVLKKTDSAQNTTDQPDASLSSSSESKAAAAKSKIKRTKATAVLNEEDEDNVTRRELSLVDVQKLAEECQKSFDRRARKKPTEQAILPKDVLRGNTGKDQAESNKKTGMKVAATKCPAFPGQATLHEEALEKTNAAQNKTDQPDASLSSSSANEAAARHSRLSAREEKERQKKDNSRRLAAVQQKLKKAEQHQKLIQGALANLDATTTRAGKHIVFDSEDDDDEHTTEAASETSAPRGDPSKEAESMPTKKRVRARASAPRLFDSSEDEEDADDEEDGGRFHIRPQFEGLAGKKLMELQSRFGTDERFRMDSRFLEEKEEEQEEDKEGNRCVSGEEDLLQEEKKRNISILQGLLGPHAHSAKPSSAKAKTFRDVSALHYDPSRDEHAAFESKADSNQDSKPARRKKREEAAKLPEVSKEIFYHVSGDLQAMFEPATDLETADRSQTCWDQKAEEGEKHEEQPAQEHSGFMFSFFGDDIQTSNDHKEYKVELIQGAKVSQWQLDPRLQDSSEEDEEEDEDQAHEGQSKAAPKTTMEESVSATNNFFFFSLDDSRLTEGPVWFCRSSQLEEEREEWDERQMELRQEYRKKHKDARKKLKSSQKTRVLKS